MILLASATRTVWWVIRLSDKAQVPPINCIKRLKTEKVILNEETLQNICKNKSIGTHVPK